MLKTASVSPLVSSVLLVGLAFAGPAFAQQATVETGTPSALATIAEAYNQRTKAVPLTEGGAGALVQRTVTWRTTWQDGKPFTADVTMAPTWSLKRNQLVLDWGPAPGRYTFHTLEGDWKNRPVELETKADLWVSYVIVTASNGQVFYVKRPDRVQRNFLSVLSVDRVTLPRNTQIKRIDMVFGRDAEGATAVWDFQ